MRKIKNNHSGFTLVELLLTLIFVTLVVLTGLYVAHNHSVSKKVGSNTTSSVAKNNTSTAPTTKLTLAQAEAEVNGLYTNYENDVIDGQVLKDKSQWAGNYPLAAGDLQFINANKEWFTQNFISKTNNYETTNTEPTDDAFMMCFNESADFNNGSFQAVAVKESGVTANLNLTYTVGGTQSTGPKKTFTLPMVLKATEGNTWAIDDIDLSSCGN